MLLNTAMRACLTKCFGHNALAESRNVAVVRKLFGYSHSAQGCASLINIFNKEHLSPYMHALTPDPVTVGATVEQLLIHTRPPIVEHPMAPYDVPLALFDEYLLTTTLQKLRVEVYWYRACPIESWTAAALCSYVRSSK